MIFLLQSILLTLLVMMWMIECLWNEIKGREPRGRYCDGALGYG